MDIIKTEIERCNRMFDDGFSLITVGADKVPNIKWKEYQTTPMNKDTFFQFLSISFDRRELESAQATAI